MKIDTLNRQPFVEQVFDLIEIISANKGNTTFAVDGAWGCGKSFVLDMLKDKLVGTQENNDESKFFVINFNCWKYDFYEEPLIAFVSAIIDILNTDDNLSVDNKIKASILDRLKKIGIGFLNIGNAVLKNKLGVDMQPIFEPLVTATKDAKNATTKQSNVPTYDTFYAFKNQLDELRKTLSEISEKQTIIIIVDELDRCLPEYAIKVLERLHHITEELPNTITVIATDKSKLTNTVKSIYGFADKDIDLYLKKFINFEVPLDNGVNDKNIIEKYADYIDKFDSIFISGDLTDFISTLFFNIPSRDQEQLFEEALLIHNLTSKERQDQTVLCAELLLIVLDKYYKIPNILNGVRTQSISYPLGNKLSNVNLLDLQNKISNAKYLLHHTYENPQRELYYIAPETNIYGIMLWYLNALMPNSVDIYNRVFLGDNTMFSKVAEKNLQFLKKYISTLKFIKQ